MEICRLCNGLRAILLLLDVLSMAVLRSALSSILKGW